MNMLSEDILWSVFDPTLDNVILNEDLIAEMARVDPSLSGINVVIFVSSKQYVDGKHWARIKVSNVIGKYSKDDNFSVSISKQPKVVAGKVKIKNSDLQDIFDWILLNYDVLMNYWNDKYSDIGKFVDKLSKL